MQTLSLEGQKHDIRVNCLAPTAATQMTDGILPPQALAQLKPERVSPGLLALVGEGAPTRAILCAGAGHFAAAHVTLTTGIDASGETAGDEVAARWTEVADRHGEIVPDYGFAQAERELQASLQRSPQTVEPAE
jgi:hypothetical protein